MRLSLSINFARVITSGYSIAVDRHVPSIYSQSSIHYIVVLGEDFFFAELDVPIDRAILVTLSPASSSKSTFFFTQISFIMRYPDRFVTHVL